MKRTLGFSLVFASILLGSSGCSKPATSTSTTVAANPTSNSTTTSKPTSNPGASGSSKTTEPEFKEPTMPTPPPGSSAGPMGGGMNKPSGAPGAAGGGGAPSRPSGAPGAAGGGGMMSQPPGSSSGPGGYPGAGGSGGPPGMSSGPGGYPGAGGSGGPPGMTSGGYPGAGSGGPPGMTGGPGAPGGPGGYPGAGGPGSSGAPGSTGSTSTEAPRQLTLRERAEDYFSKGREADAVALIQAHMLTSSESADYLDRMRFSPTRKQPQIAVRIAVGVDLVKGAAVNGKYNPISSKAAGSSSRGPGPGGMGGDFSPGGSGGFPGGGSSSATSESLEDITGDMGTALKDQISELFGAGQLGTAFANLEDKSQGASGSAGSAGGFAGGMSGMGGGMMGSGRPGGAPGGRPGGAPGGAPGGFPGGSGGGGAPGNFENSIDGAVGTSNSAGGAPPTGPGGYPGGPGGMGGAGFGGGAAGAPPAPIGKLADPNPNRVTPGLTFIGIDDTKDLLEKSLDNKYDLLIVFEVTLEASRNPNRPLNNSCRAKLFKPGEKKALASTEQLSSVDVNRRIQKGEKDIVEKAMKPFFKKLAENASMKDIPTGVTVEGIQKRATTLASDRSRVALESLSELKLWNHLQLLSNDEYQAAVKQILNADSATMLLSGSEDDKVAALKKFIP